MKCDSMIKTSSKDLTRRCGRADGVREGAEYRDVTASENA